MHELDYFWVEKNPDKRFTKHPFVVISRDSLYQQGTIDQTGLTFKQATHEASWRKKVRADLIHQIWWAETNQEEKEIERRKNIKLTPKQKKKHWENYGKWRVEYLKKFLKV